MKRLMYLIRDTFLYYSKGISICAAIYFLAVAVGMIIFYSEKTPINPKSISFFELFLHNLFSVMLIIVAGMISFGFLGNLILIANGVILGRIIIGVFNQYGISPILNNIAPHFVFEATAMIIATAISCETLKFLHNIKSNKIKVIRLKYCVSVFFLMIFLLVCSALIESQLGG